MSAEEFVNEIQYKYEHGEISKEEAMKKIHWAINGGIQCDCPDGKKHLWLIICDIIVKIITLGIVKIIKKQK